MGECVSVLAINDFAARDVNRIVGKIQEVLVRKSPFVDVLDGGTLENVSNVVRSVVQERAVVASSLAEPVFTEDVTMCQVQGGTDQVGSTEYSFYLATLRGKGPRVCVKQMRTAFKGSYVQAQLAMEKGILQIMNADVRATLQRRSGVKFVCKQGYTLDQLLTGDMQQIDTLYANVGLPDAPMSFKTLYRLGIFLSEDMLAEPWESETGTFFKVVASQELITKLRDEADIRGDFRSLTTGQYKIGEMYMTRYRWEGPYRGFAFGVDPQPLRFNTMTGNLPNFIEPEIGVAVSNGVAARRNPAWVTANYEVGFLMASNSFRRLVPQQYTGEGTFKFPAQATMGELEWVFIRDNDCNLYGDYGQHIYQVSRAYQPVRPHAVIPFIYQRCPYDLGLAGCVSSISGI
jgi:hypothetical protein